MRKVTCLRRHNATDTMQSIIEVRGHQYLVRKGDVITTEIVDAEEGATIAADRVLATIAADGAMTLGAPALDVKVQLKVLSFEKGEKIDIIKFKRRKRYTKRQGHRQQLVQLQVL